MKEEKKERDTKLHFILTLVFLVLVVVLFFLLDNRKINNQQQHLQLITKRYQLAYNTIYDQYKQLATTIHSGFLRKYDIQTVYQKLQTADEDQKNRLREELLDQTRLRFEELKKTTNLRQFHFHLQNNESFLRIHLPEKFGDNLTDLRETVNYVNTEHLPIDGFEAGGIFTGYRFVFPITAADQSHLGSMEISFSPAALTSSVMKQYRVLSNFHFNEVVITSKIFPGEKERVYRQSPFKGYLCDKGVLDALKTVSRKELKELICQKNTLDAVISNVHSGRPISLYAPEANAVLTTLPVFNPVTQEMVAFITIRSQSNFFIKEIHHFRIVFSLSLVLLSMIFFTFYMQYRKRKVLEINTEKLEYKTKQLVYAQNIANLGHWELNIITEELTWSDQIYSIFDIPPGQFVVTYDAFMEVVHPDDRDFVNTSYMDSLKTHNSYDINHRIITKDGVEKWVREICTTEFDETGKPLRSQGIVQDITEQKQLEEKLFQAQKMEAVGTLAGGIAHDFNNILSVIIGYSEIAKADILAGTGQPDKDIDEVLTAGKRATDLVKQILTFSRKSEQHTHPLSPHLIVKETLKMLRASLPTTISIQQDIDPECGDILANSTKIHQVVMNLCTNALHAMADENGTLSISLGRRDIRAEQIQEKDVPPGPFMVLSISDTGHGMDQETIKRIFEPYFTTKKVGKGTGLGLAVIYGIIKEYKGFIEVESELGKGTTFHLYIPVMKKDSSIENKNTDENVPLPTGTERILVVDDEDAIVDINKTELERLGYTVTATTDSLDALAKIRTNPDKFDMLITDQTMPNMTGSKLAQEVLRIKSNMPIVLCTGYSSAVSEDDALEIGIKQYVKKPIDRAALAQIVRQVLDEN